MHKTPKTKVIWQYTPPDFISQDLPEVNGAGCTWHLTNGRATCVLVPPQDPLSDELRKKLRITLQQMFDHQCCVSDRQYSLGEHPNIEQHTETGLNRVMILGTGHLRATGSSVGMSVSVTDASGEVISSTGQQLDQEAKGLADTAAKQRAVPTLARLFGAYRRAIESPEHEPIRLFEIIEILDAHFGTNRKAKKALIGTAKVYTTLGTLANDAPILEGRHVGKHADALRPMTDEERQQGRAAAKALIAAFCNTL
jgi:hypothetical protein